MIVPKYESRTLSEINKLSGYVLQSYIDKHEQVRVVDLGCGFGRTLWELQVVNNHPLSEFRGIYYSKYTEKDRQIIVDTMNICKSDPNYTLQLFNTFVANADMNRVHFIEQDLNHGLQFPDQSIDFIYSSNCFHYLKEKIFVLYEINRVLSPNGTAIIVADRINNWSLPSGEWPRLRIFQSGSFLNGDGLPLVDLLCSLGFNLECSVHQKSLILEIKKSQNIDFGEYKLDRERSLNINDYRNGKIIPAVINSNLSNIYGAIPNDPESLAGYLSIYRKKQ